MAAFLSRLCRAMRQQRGALRRGLIPPEHPFRLHPFEPRRMAGSILIPTPSGLISSMDWATIFGQAVTVEVDSNSFGQAGAVGTIASDGWSVKVQWAEPTGFEGGYVLVRQLDVPENPEVSSYEALADGLFEDMDGDPQTGLLYQFGDPQLRLTPDTGYSFVLLAYTRSGDTITFSSTATQIDARTLHPGDATGDGRVDFNDLVRLNQNWNQSNRTWAQGDFTGEGTVNSGDLLILSQNYNTDARLPTPTVTATAISSTQVQVSWELPSGSPAVEGFEVWYATGGSGYLWAGAYDQETSSLIIGDLLPGTSYQFVVNSDRGTARSEYSTPASATTHPLPSGTLDYDGPADEGSPLTVGFSNVEPAAGTFTYDFDFDGDPDNGWDVTGSSSPSASHTLADDGIYAVLGRIRDAGGGYSPAYYSIVTVDNVAPTLSISGPSTALAGAPYSLTLSASADPGPDTIQYWDIDWGDGTGFTRETSSPASHTYTGVNRQYSITAWATDEDGTYQADSIDVTTYVTPPAAPSGLTATGGIGQATLTWGDQSNDEAGFKIERSRDGGSFAEIGWVGADVTTYEATGLADGIYTFRVRAFNAAGNSAYSSDAPATVTRWITSSVTGAEVAVEGNTILMGVADRLELDEQPSAVHGAALLLPPAAQYTITFDYDLSTWDSYCAYDGDGTGYWDSFSVGVAAQPYWNLPWVDPVLLPFVWPDETARWGDEEIVTDSGTRTITIAGNPSGDNYLNVVLDTDTPYQNDDQYPSWGSITITSVLAPVDLQAHRSGGRFGDVVSETIEDAGDPTQYLILSNNDFEEAADGELDFDDTAATIPVGTVDPVDDDLARIVLKSIGSYATSGSIELAVSDPTAVRLFASDGTELTSLTLDLSSPSGYLAGLTSGDVDVWVEGLHKDSDLTLSLIYRDGSSSELWRDEVHMLIADWTFAGPNANDIGLVESIGKGAIADLVSGISGARPIPDSALFKARIDGLPPALVEQLRVRSDSNPCDYFDDALVANGGAAESSLYAVVYHSTDAFDTFSASERTEILSVLGVNVVHNAGAATTLQTPQDEQARKQAAVHLTIKQLDPFFPEGRVKPIQRVIFDSGVPIHFAVGVGPGDTVRWDFDGDGSAGDPDDPFEANTAGERSVTYSPDPSAANNVNLAAIAANRRASYDIKAEVTSRGKTTSLLWTIRVALPAKKLLHDLPLNVPADRAATNAWLKPKYEAAIPGAPVWSNAGDIPELENLVRTWVGGPDNVALLDANRLIVGVDPWPDPKVGAVTLVFQGPLQDGKYPQAKVVGTAVGGAGVAGMFQYDTPEFEWFLEHERNQVKCVSGYIVGNTVEAKLFAAYHGSADPAVRNARESVRQVWNQVERMAEDLSRAAAGNVSWSAMGEFLATFWKTYSTAVSGNPQVPGSLANIRALEQQQKLPAGSYAAAYAKLVDIYRNLPWRELREISGVMKMSYYHFRDPADPFLMHPKPPL